MFCTVPVSKAEKLRNLSCLRDRDEALESTQVLRAVNYWNGDELPAVNGQETGWRSGLRDQRAEESGATGRKGSC